MAIAALDEKPPSPAPTAPKKKSWLPRHLPQQPRLRRHPIPLHRRWLYPQSLGSSSIVSPVKNRISVRNASSSAIIAQSFFSATLQRLVQRYRHRSAPSPGRLCRPTVIHQNPPNYRRRNLKEMRPVLPYASRTRAVACGVSPTIGVKCSSAARSPGANLATTG